MKKRLFSFVMAATLVIGGLFIPEAEPAYAASATKISSARDLLKMEEDPAGNYVLTKDITVPENTCLFASGTSFMGTLDGKGHKLKGYRSTEARAIFYSAKYATFKNLSITKVNIKVNGPAAALVYESDTCSFNNVSVSGTIVSTGSTSGWTDSERGVGGIAAYGNGEMVKCRNSAKITAKNRKYTTNVGGLAGNFEATLLKDCSNSGAVTLSTGTQGYDFSIDSTAVFSAAGLVAGISDKTTSCKNSGSVTVNLNYTVNEKKPGNEFVDSEESISVYAAGVCMRTYGAITSSGNTGKIKVTSKSKTKVYGGVWVGGVAASASPGNDAIAGNELGQIQLSKCYNTGAVSFTGAVYRGNYYDDEACWIGGLFGTGDLANQCYNTGNVTVSFSDGNRANCSIGGIAGHLARITNSYNTGNVTMKNKGKHTRIQTGGIAGIVADYYGDITCNYSTGKCTSNQRWNGQLFGYWYGYGALSNKRYLYNNYYKGSGKAYGPGDTSWGPYQPTAKKVSSITSGSCPKLSSKYWTYSSKHRRLILKNNKEK